MGDDKKVKIEGAFTQEVEESKVFIDGTEVDLVLISSPRKGKGSTGMKILMSGDTKKLAMMIATALDGGRDNIFGAALKMKEVSDVLENMKKSLPREDREKLEKIMKLVKKKVETSDEFLGLTISEEERLERLREEENEEGIEDGEAKVVENKDFNSFKATHAPSSKFKH